MYIDCKYWSIKFLSNLFVFFPLFVLGQNSINGNLENEINKKVNLIIHEGIKSIVIDSTTTDTKGNFLLKYPLTYSGVGTIIVENKQQIPILIEGKDIDLYNSSGKIYFKNNTNNENLYAYANAQSFRDNAQKALQFLIELYKQKEDSKALLMYEKELKKLENERQSFLHALDSNSIAFKYIRLKEKIFKTQKSDSPNEIHSNINDFYTVNLTDSFLIHSGLYLDLLKKHFDLIEQSGAPIDLSHEMMANSIDYCITQLNSKVTHKELLEDIIHFLFNYFEKQSLYILSEYLSNKTFENDITINRELSYRMEYYRTMKLGNTVSDIPLNEIKLSEIKAKYKILFFGASWCHKCVDEIEKIKDKIIQWESKEIEFILISLDSNQDNFKNFVKTTNAKFSYCDYMSWDSKIAKAFFIYATPTIYVINNNNQIILKPISVEQLNVWINNL